MKKTMALVLSLARMLGLLSGCGSSLSAGPMRRTLPELRPGDPVIIEMLGADGRSLSCAYGGAAPCREYLVRADGEIVPV